MIRNLVTVLLTAVVLVSFGCGNDKKDDQASGQSQEIPPLSVETVTVQSEKIPIWIEYTGKTEASRRIEVRARVAGRLDKVLFTEGQSVVKGQQLFEIEKTIYEAAVEQAKAKLEGDLASLKLAKSDVARYVPLVEEGLAPRVTLEQYEARAQELEAQIKGNRAQIIEAELQLSYTEVVAPISGRIGKMDVDVGNIVGYSEKTLLTTIVYDNPMYAYFNPPEEQYLMMRKYRSKEQLDARVRVPSKMEKRLERGQYKGFVDFSDNRVDRMTSTITMRAVVDNDKHDLLEGTFVYVNVFVTDQAPFLMVPPSVVQEDQLGSYVYLVDSQNIAKRADIMRGHEGRKFLMVDKGLQDGDRVIISGLAKIRPGKKVAPADVTNTKGVLAVMKQSEMVPERE